VGMPSLHTATPIKPNDAQAPPTPWLVGGTLRAAVGERLHNMATIPICFQATGTHYSSGAFNHECNGPSHC